MSDLTVVYYTSNQLPDATATAIRTVLRTSCVGLPIISVSQKPLAFGRNIHVGEIGASTRNLYYQVLVGAKAANTDYVALCEDDCLYPPSHFTTVLPDDFGYNMNRWRVHTWDAHPVFSHKNRCGLHQLVCPRDLLIEHLEERFSRNHTEDQINRHWGEPGRWNHEQRLGVSCKPLSQWRSAEPCVVFFHPYSLNYRKQGVRVAHGRDGVVKLLPPWGTAKDVIDQYWGRLENRLTFATEPTTLLVGEAGGEEVQYA